MLNKTRRTVIATLILVVGVVLTLSACGGKKHNNAKTNAHSKAQAAVQNANREFVVPPVKNFVDYNNYYKAQELYDSPSTIIWCTTSFGTTGSPLVTVPITGKLTSSSVSLFPNTQVHLDTDTGGSTYYPELTSVDGMYHGSPPPYRYGFTPGGQYVDFSGMQVLCTTALTKFQKQSTTVDVSYDPAVSAAQAQAQKDLAVCNARRDAKNASSNNKSCVKAQKDLQDALGGN